MDLYVECRREKKNFKLLLDFWSEKLKFNCASKYFTVKNIR